MSSFHSNKKNDIDIGLKKKKKKSRRKKKKEDIEFDITSVLLD